MISLSRNSTSEDSVEFFVVNLISSFKNMKYVKKLEKNIQ